MGYVIRVCNKGNNKTNNKIGFVYAINQQYILSKLLLSYMTVSKKSFRSKSSIKSTSSDENKYFDIINKLSNKY